MLAGWLLRVSDKLKVMTLDAVIAYHIHCCILCWYMKKVMKGQQGESVPRGMIRFVPAVGLNTEQVEQLRRQSGLR